MPRADDPTSALLGALAQTQRILIDGAQRLSADTAMTNVTYDLSFWGADPDELLRRGIREQIERVGAPVVIGGYVDVRPEGFHGAAWLFDIVDLDDELRLDREIVLYPLEGSDVEHSLPDARFPDWAELAAALPALVEELLATPLPAADR